MLSVERERPGRGGVDGAGVGGVGAEVGADHGRGQAEAAAQLPDMRAVRLLRRPQGPLPAAPLLLLHQLQRTQPTHRLLLLHPKDLQLLRLPTLKHRCLLLLLNSVSLSSLYIRESKNYSLYLFTQLVHNYFLILG